MYDEDGVYQEDSGTYAQDQWIEDQLKAGLSVCQECLTPFQGSTPCPSCGCTIAWTPQPEKPAVLTPEQVMDTKDLF